MTRDALDQVAAETGILYGVKVAKEGRVLSPEAIERVASRALADFEQVAGISEREAATRFVATWYDAFARGFSCGVAAMTQPRPDPPREREGRILRFNRR